MSHTGVVGGSIITQRTLDRTGSGGTTTRGGIDHTFHEALTDFITQSGGGDDTRNTVNTVTGLHYIVDDMEVARCGGGLRTVRWFVGIWNIHSFGGLDLLGVMNTVFDPIVGTGGYFYGLFLGMTRHLFNYSCDFLGQTFVRQKESVT